MIKISALSDQVVGTALTALQNKDREGFVSLIGPNVVFTHNNEPDDIFAWADSFFFGAQEAIITPLKESPDGRTIRATIAIAQVGEIQAKLVFEISNGLISSLNASKAS